MQHFIEKWPSKWATANRFWSLGQLFDIFSSVVGEDASPVVIHLVDDEDLVADLLLVEECVNEGNEHQQLLKALSEGNHDGQFVRPPRRVVHHGCLTAGRAGRRRLLGHASFSVRRRHVTWTAELQPEQRDEDQHHAQPEQLVDGAFTGQVPDAQKKKWSGQRLAGFRLRLINRCKEMISLYLTT